MFDKTPIPPPRRKRKEKLAKLHISPPKDFRQVQKISSLENLENLVTVRTSARTTSTLMSKARKCCRRQAKVGKVKKIAKFLETSGPDGPSNGQQDDSAYTNVGVFPWARRVSPVEPPKFYQIVFSYEKPSSMQKFIVSTSSGTVKVNKFENLYENPHPFSLHHRLMLQFLWRRTKRQGLMKHLRFTTTRINRPSTTTSTNNRGRKSCREFPFRQFG